MEIKYSIQTEIRRRFKFRFRLQMLIDNFKRKMKVNYMKFFFIKTTQGIRI